ncbi:MAG: MMPL family transporter [Candidatus Thermoplasmatota archaeon]
MRAALVVAVCLLACVAAGLGASRLRPEVDFVDTVPQDEPGLQEYRALLERLDGVRFVAVHMPAAEGLPAGALRSDAAFDALVLEQRDLTEHLQREFPGAFSHTLSVYEAMRQGNYMLQKIATAGNPPDSAYALPSDPASQRSVRDEVRGDAGRDVLAADGSSALLLAFLTTHDQDEARALSGDIADSVAAWDRKSTGSRVTNDAQASGLLVAAHATDQRNRHDLATWGLASTAAVTIATLLVVRRPTNVLIAAVSLAAATLWTFGLVGAFGIPISFLTIFLAPLVTGVGVDYAIHLLQRYEEERDVGNDRAHSLRTALRTNGPAVAVSAGVTAGGLLVLLLVPNPLFAQMGLVAALGIACGLVASLTLAPALRAVLPERRRRAPRPPRIGPAVAAVGSWSLRHPVVVFGLVAVLTAGAAFAAATQTRLEPGSSATEVPADDPLIVLQRRIEAEYGSFQRAYLVVEGDLTQPHALQSLLVATSRVTQIPLATEASSITDLLVSDDATDQGLLDILLGTAQSPSDEQRLPQTEVEAREDLQALFDDPLWRTIAPFTIDREPRAEDPTMFDYPFGVVALKLEPTQDREALLAFRDALRAEAAMLQEALGPDYHVAAAGAPLNRVAVVEQTPDNVRLATVGVGAVVLAGLSLSWIARRGGLRTAVLCTLVVLTAALWLLASIPLLDATYRGLAQTGAPHNSAALTDMFLLAFAITIAVGVDNLVHIAHRDWENRAAGLPAAVARTDALTHGGGAVVGTSLTTFVAFAVLSGVYFLQSKNLAILTALGVLYTTLLTVLLAPWILKAKGAKSSGWLP